MEKQAVKKTPSKKCHDNVIQLSYRQIQHETDIKYNIDLESILNGFSIVFVSIDMSSINVWRASPNFQLSSKSMIEK